MRRFRPQLASNGQRTWFTTKCSTGLYACMSACSSGGKYEIHSDRPCNPPSLFVIISSRTPSRMRRPEDTWMLRSSHQEGAPLTAGTFEVSASRTNDVLAFHVDMQHPCPISHHGAHITGDSSINWPIPTPGFFVMKCRPTWSFRHTSDSPRPFATDTPLPTT